jgi:hypothetical protein
VLPGAAEREAVFVTSGSPPASPATVSPPRMPPSNGRVLLVELHRSLRVDLRLIAALHFQFRKLRLQPQHFLLPNSATIRNAPLSNLTYDDRKVRKPWMALGHHVQSSIRVPPMV